MHPNEQNRPPHDASAITSDSVPSGLTDEALSAWIHTKRALVEAVPVLRLGTDSRGPELFGYVPRAAIGSDGNIVVLDADAQEIRIFDSDGGFVERFGGWGDGPMELRGAIDFHLFPDGRIAVSLGRLGPIKIFQRSDRGWELLDIVDFRPTPANSLCGMSDGRLFSGGYQREYETILNEFDAGIRRFGRGYQHEHSLIRMTLSGGLVECLEQPDRIVFGFMHLPIVRSYTTEGVLQWTAVARDDYLQLEIIEKRHPETGAVGVSRRVVRDHDRLIGIHSVGSDGQLLLQYGRFFWTRREIVPQSYLVDTVTGFGAYLDADSLPIVLSTHHDGYIALFQEPYPHLEVRRMGTHETLNQ